MVGMMRITFISDTHNKHKQLTHILPGGDLLIHAGDLTGEGYQKEITNFLIGDYERSKTRHVKEKFFKNDADMELYETYVNDECKFFDKIVKPYNTITQQINKKCKPVSQQLNTNEWLTSVEQKFIEYGPTIVEVDSILDIIRALLTDPAYHDFKFPRVSIDTERQIFSLANKLWLHYQGLPDDIGYEDFMLDKSIKEAISKSKQSDSYGGRELLEQIRERKVSILNNCQTMTNLNPNTLLTNGIQLDAGASSTDAEYAWFSPINVKFKKDESNYFHIMQFLGIIDEIQQVITVVCLNVYSVKHYGHSKIPVFPRNSENVRSLKRSEKKFRETLVGIGEITDVVIQNFLDFTGGKFMGDCEIILGLLQQNIAGFKLQERFCMFKKENKNQEELSETTSEDAEFSEDLTEDIVINNTVKKLTESEITEYNNNTPMKVTVSCDRSCTAYNLLWFTRRVYSPYPLHLIGIGLTCVGNMFSVLGFTNTQVHPGYLSEFNYLSIHYLEYNSKTEEYKKLLKEKHILSVAERGGGGEKKEKNVFDEFWQNALSQSSSTLSSSTASGGREGGGELGKQTFPSSSSSLPQPLSSSSSLLPPSSSSSSSSLPPSSSSSSSSSSFLGKKGGNKNRISLQKYKRPMQITLKRCFKKHKISKKHKINKLLKKSKKRKIIFK